MRNKINIHCVFPVYDNPIKVSPILTANSAISNAEINEIPIYNDKDPPRLLKNEEKVYVGDSSTVSMFMVEKYTLI